MDEDAKPSNRKQWQERSGKPIATRSMTKEDILHFKEVLAQSYKCSPSEFMYNFQKIIDENDEDREDCLLLVYRMNVIHQDKPEKRIVYTLKVPVPEEIRMRAEKAKMERQMVRSNSHTSEARPTPETRQPIVTEPDDQPKPAAKPVLRRPARRTGK